MLEYLVPVTTGAFGSPNVSVVEMLADDRSDVKVQFAMRSVLGKSQTGWGFNLIGKGKGLVQGNGHQAQKGKGK
jgi:hypothetical protein